MGPTATAAGKGLASALSDIEAFADALPQLTYVVAPDGRLAFVNRAWREYVGLDVGGTFEERLDAIHPDDRQAVQDAIRDRVPEGEFRARRASDGMYRWHLFRWEYVFDDDGKSLYRVGTAIDVHDRYRLSEDLAFLSAASRTMNATLDLEATLRTIARVAVPRLADWCEIDLFGRDGIVTRAFAHRDGAIDETLQALVGRVHDVNPTAHYERVETALRAGRTLFTRFVLDEMSEAIVQNRRMLDLYKRAGVASSVIVPLFSRDRVLGWVVFMRTDAQHPYEEEDLPLMEEYGARAALAIDNAQLFGREHRVADAMQNASLPRKLPKIPAIDMYAIYVPGQTEAQVGGDWYDAFRLRDGRLVISVGDVSGSGVDAAVTMSNMRQVIRGTAQVHADPVLMLDAADSALRLEENDRYVTACVAVIDPVSRTMTYASAGHPPPYVRDKGSTPVPLTFEGLPLGLRQHRSPRHASTLQLKPGTVLVFYTDGLIESNHDILSGIASLERLIGSRDFYYSANPAKFIRSHMLDGGARDDVAILVVRVRAPSEHTADSTRRIYCWTYDSVDPDVLTAVRERLQHVLEEHGLGADAIERAKLVLGELVGNVARHAPGALQIVVDMTTSSPVLHVVDEGVGFERVPALPDVLSESGRGLFIVSELTQEFTISRGPGGGSHARAVLDT